MLVGLARRFKGIVWLLGVVTLGAGCSSSNSSTPIPDSSAGAGGLSSSGGASTATDVGGEAGAAACPDFRGVPIVGPGPGSGCSDGNTCFSCITPVQGLSFAAGTFSITDASGSTSANLRVEPGRACMAGTSVGFASLDLILSAGFRKPFDAAAHGITQLEFTVETPPSSGVVPSLSVLLPDLSVGGSDLMSDGQPVSIVSPMTERVRLSDFETSNVADDPSRMLTIAFAIGAVEHYDFCVSKLKFFDANDVEVMP